MGIDAGKNKISLVKWGFIAALWLAAMGAILFFYANTLILWWWPVLIAVVTGCLAAGIINVRQSSGEKNILIIIISGIVCATAAGLIFLGGNWFFSDKETHHEEKVRIERKFTRKHYRNRRVGRNRYVPDHSQPYYSYHADVRFDTGKVKERTLTAGQYAKCRAGDKITLEMEKGAFGFPVIKN